MATKELRDRVDAQWRDQASAWGQENHDRERKLIYDYLEQDENIMGLVGCTWGPASAFHEGAGLMLRQQRVKGVAVATNRSVHLVARKGFNKLVTQISLPSITAVEQAGGIVTVDGDGIHNWAGMAQDDPFQIRDVGGDRGAPFAELVQRLQTGPPTTVSPPSAGQYLGTSKAQRIDAQWQEHSPMRGRTNRGILAGLLGSLSGDNLKKYDGERQKLHEVLDEDENIEFWLGGRWGLPGDFESYHTMNPGSGHDGIAVATDRRVLLLGSGLLGSKEVELPYDRIDGVDYNDGMISSGIEFQGSTIETYSFYFDHNNKANVKGQARRLADCVRRHLVTPPTAD
ncbi:MAG: PH domain-containing protein [Dehalococcoidia bacterium]|nr:PH domain-containing protein [Dehalococcoidia bacterium]